MIKQEDIKIGTVFDVSGQKCIITKINDFDFEVKWLGNILGSEKGWDLRLINHRNYKWELAKFMKTPLYKKLEGINE